MHPSTHLSADSLSINRANNAIFVCHRDGQSQKTMADARGGNGTGSCLGFFGRTLSANDSELHQEIPQLQSEPNSIQVKCLVRTRIPSEFGNATHSLLLYTNSSDTEEHLALVYGYGQIFSLTLEKIYPNETTRDRLVRGASVSPLVPSDITTEPPLARIHSCCFTGETLGSLRCDCREQLVQAMKLMSTENRGVILYLKQEGRGIGLKDKMRAYNLIDQGYDTHEANIELGHPADGRSYLIATAILRDLQIPSVRLLTNNPHKVESIVADGVIVSERVPMIPASWALGNISSSDRENASSEIQDRDGYLITKVKKMGHILDIPEDVLTRSRNTSAGSHHL